MGNNFKLFASAAFLTFTQSAFAFMTHDEVLADFVNPAPHHQVGYASGARRPASFQKVGSRPLQSISSDIPSEVDLRKFDAPVVTQPGPTCTAFGTAAAIDNMLHQKGLSRNISEQHLWSFYQEYDVDSAFAAAQKNFLTEEQYWPIDANKPKSDYRNHANVRMLQSTSHDDDVNAALQALSQNHPVVIALQVSKSLYNCDSSVSPTSKKYGGGHVVEVAGYKLDPKVSGGGYFILKNSWGNDCGDKGYQYYPFSLCSRNDLYCYFIEVNDVQGN